MSGADFVHVTLHRLRAGQIWVFAAVEQMHASFGNQSMLPDWLRRVAA